MCSQKKVAVITGAGSGIGKGTALAFAREGYRVVVAELVEQSGEETCAEVIKQGKEAIFVQADVSDVASVQVLLTTVAKKWGRVDVLVNNAGIGSSQNIAEMDETDWDRVVDTNLRSVFLCTRAALPLMPAEGGSIVNVSSVDSLRCYPGIAPYAASKGGMNSLTKALAVDLGPRRIRVNAVLPGYIQTAMWDRWMAGLSEAEQQRTVAKVLSLLVIKRPGTIADVAEAVLFLASDKASYITGASLLVDGGLMAQGPII